MKDASGVAHTVAGKRREQTVRNIAGRLSLADVDGVSVLATRKKEVGGATKAPLLLVSGACSFHL